MIFVGSLDKTAFIKTQSNKSLIWKAFLIKFKVENMKFITILNFIWQRIIDTESNWNVYVRVLPLELLI